MPYCGDCETNYYLQSAAEHWLVCPARTCIVCEEDFDHALKVNADGDRVCDGCREDRDEVEVSYDGDEDGEGGD